MSLSSPCPSHCREAWPWPITHCGFLRGSHTRFGQMKWYKRSGRKKARVSQVREEPAPPHHLAVLHRYCLWLWRHRAHLSNASAWIGGSSSNEDVPYHPGQMQGQCQTSVGFEQSCAAVTPPLSLTQDAAWVNATRLQVICCV